MGYKFTEDWFHWAPGVWGQLAPNLPARKSFIEIGSYEGRSTVWTVENMMEDGGSILCVDTWGGGEEHQVNAVNMSKIEETFDANMAALKEQYPERNIGKVKGSSYEALTKLEAAAGPFDFAYIDGSHLSRDVITDACLLWPKMKIDGVLVFDDYLWGHPRDVLHRPKIAIDAFTTMFSEELAVVHVGYQFIVKKVKG